MNTLVAHIRTWGSSMHLATVVILIGALFTFWTLTLAAFGGHFQQVSGQPLLDLQNVRGVLSPDAALALILAYPVEARSLYWTFFVLDNITPLLVFGSLSLLWVNILHRHANRWAQRLLSSPFILLPLGVGLFDIAENVCFVMAISAPSAAMLPVLTVGLALVQLKAACLLASFALTALLLAWQLGTSALSLLRRGTAAHGAGSTS